MKTSDLIGKALNWAVGKCEGTLGQKPDRCFDCAHHEERAIQDGSDHYCWHPESKDLSWDSNGDGPYFGEGISVHHGVHRLCPINELTPEPYSTNWLQGGPIIEREKITISDANEGWVAGYNGTLSYFGPTPLIAAMRCFVASEMGDEVEIPEGLK